MNDEPDAGRQDAGRRDADLDRMRHSAAHLLAEGVQALFPEAKLASSAAIEHGFSCDFDLPRPLTPDDLGAIEDRMRELQSRDEPFVREVISRDDALRRFDDNPYTAEIIEGLPPDEPITTYRHGGLVDLGRGPHVASTGQIGPFKLESVAGAYWRGDERHPMLQRVYGTVWPTQAELDRYLDRREEARQRDHRRLGPLLDLFFFHPSAPGMPYWLPNGLTLYNQLVGYWRAVHEAHEYAEISTPQVNKRELYETSGHWGHYRDDMFHFELDDGEAYGLKPMNCPNAMVTFGFRRRSYRDLPMRLADVSMLHRFERSGTLNGLLRAREFHQDDAHIFVSQDQIAEEFRDILSLVDHFYARFELSCVFRLGTRPEDFIGDVETWSHAERTLEALLRESGRDFWIEAGDGAFYGPKVDILMKDSLGREWQMGTIQLDFQMPRRFELAYTAEDGSLKTPIVIHRAIFGSLERFIGILIEHVNGAFPPWLAPVQAIVIPVTDSQTGYAESVADRLRRAGMRVALDASGDRMQAKIRNAQVRKVPWMLVVGKREVDGGTVSVRPRSGDDLGAMPVDAFLDLAIPVIEAKALHPYPVDATRR